MTRDTTGTVLVVDDEQMVVTSIESFLQLETSHRVLCYTSAETALRSLEETQPDVVVADFLMPDMNGITFLKEIREARPRTTRVLLTGYADKENAIRAINEVGLYQYLEKPWDNQNLKLVIQNGVERSRLLRDLEGRMEALEEANSELSDLHRRLIETFL
jgi:DNA-binding NtrC family response regulator